MRPILVLLVFAPTLLAAPPEVAVCQPVEREITDFVETTGRTEASTTVQVRSRVTGVLDKVMFKEGAEVKKGDILFQLDDRVQRGELAKVEAEVARADARLQLAESKYQRAKALANAKAIDKEELENLAAAAQEAKAATLAARAGIELARLNVEYTRIIAPISGRIGRSAVDAGNVVRGDVDGPLATLVVLDPIHVSFHIDERSLLRLRKLIRDQNDAKVVVGLRLADEKGIPRQAAIDFIDSSIDPESATMRIRITLPNPKGELFQGQSVRARIPTSLPRKALLVPVSAVRDAPSGHIMVVAHKSVVKRPVKYGQIIEEMVVIEEGLKPDDWVIINPRGHHVGEEVTPQRDKPPAEQPKPKEPLVRISAPRPLAEFPAVGPALVITANYPGADSGTLGETVAAPIEAQLDGLDGVLHRVVACTDQGEMRLTIMLKKGTDFNKALSEAQKRVALAEPTLPDVVRREGVKLKKQPIHLLAVAVSSPDNQYDRKYLAEYSDKRIRDELARVSGVAAVSLYGDVAPTTRLRVMIDPDRVMAFGIKTADISNAIRDQNLSATAVTGRVPIIAVSGDVTDPEQLQNVVVKSGKEGQAIRLKDLARVDVVAGWGTATNLDGKACVLLLVSRSADADARVTAKAVRAQLAELAKAFPVGVTFKVLDEEP